jgi:hypothetical protein
LASSLDIICVASIVSSYFHKASIDFIFKLLKASLSLPKNLAIATPVLSAEVLLIPSVDNSNFSPAPSTFSKVASILSKYYFTTSDYE